MVHDAVKSMLTRIKRSRARAAFRHVALNGLSRHYQRAGKEHVGLATQRIALPYLHAVPDREQDALRRFIEALAVNHTFISYSEAVRRVQTGQIDRPYVAFSFDDGFASNVQAARILEEFGVTGMFFVPTGFVGVPTVAEAREFFGFVRGCDEPAMTWGDLERMKSKGHEIGNHTCSHRILANLSEAEQYDEVASAAETLRARLGESKHFAWPYGRFLHFSEHAARAVFETGHVSCASAERGAHRIGAVADSAALCLRRDHIMTGWPLKHCTYFMARSGVSASARDNLWPGGWAVS